MGFDSMTIQPLYMIPMNDRPKVKLMTPQETLASRYKNSIRTEEEGRRIIRLHKRQEAERNGKGLRDGRMSKDSD
jgi:hypothetical protein